MTILDRLTSAMGDRAGAAEMFPDRLAAACVAVLPADGAGLTVTYTPGRRLPIGASDPASQAAERLQFTLGEGPCLLAQHARSAVRATAEDLAARWPSYWVELSTSSPFRSVLAAPRLPSWPLSTSTSPPSSPRRPCPTPC